MAISILHDRECGQAALYDTTTGRPLPIEIFRNSEDESAVEAAGRFIDDAERHFGGLDIRRIATNLIHEYRKGWAA